MLLKNKQYSFSYAKFYIAMILKILIFGKLPLRCSFQNCLMQNFFQYFQNGLTQKY